MTVKFKEDLKMKSEYIASLEEEKRNLNRIA